MKFHVQTLRLAESDIRAIVHYLAERSPSGAASWLDALEKAYLRLENEADTLSLALESDRFDLDLRQLLFKTRRGRVYRLVYTIDGDAARVLRVRGPGQAPVDPHDLDQIQ